MSKTWHDGMSDALKVVRSISRTFRDLRPPGAQAILDDLETTFAAALERGHLSRSQVCGEDERRAPLQGTDGRLGRRAGTISWEEHEEIYAVYAARYGTSQSAQRIADRGGFGWTECEMLMKREPRTWRPA